MRKMRTIVVDDEPLARKLLLTLLDGISSIEIVGVCENGRDTVRAVQEFTPDLLILDIQMPGFNGFDVIKSLQADVVPMVIFCTAFQRYALDAFDLNAVDYLLKPVDPHRLDRAIQRAGLRFEDDIGRGRDKHAVLGAIDDIAKRVSGRPAVSGSQPGSPSDRKMSIKDGDTISLVDIDDIDWIDAAGDYMCVHQGKKTHILRSTIKDLLARLDPDSFKRIHRSTIVNLARIEGVQQLSKGEYMLLLNGGEKLKVSRSYRDSIKNYLAQT